MNTKIIKVSVTHDELLNLTWACHVLDGIDEFSTKWRDLQLKLELVLKVIDEDHVIGE